MPLREDWNTIKVVQSIVRICHWLKLDNQLIKIPHIEQIRQTQLRNVSKQFMTAVSLLRKSLKNDKVGIIVVHLVLDSYGKSLWCFYVNEFAINDKSLQTRYDSELRLSVSLFYFNNYEVFIFYDVDTFILLLY